MKLKLRKELHSFIRGQTGRSSPNLFKLYSAQERLAYVENRHPDLIQRVAPPTQLASFLPRIKRNPEPHQETQDVGTDYVTIVTGTTPFHC